MTDKHKTVAPRQITPPAPPIIATEPKKATVKKQIDSGEEQARVSSLGAISLSIGVFALASEALIISAKYFFSMPKIFSVALTTALMLTFPLAVVGYVCGRIGLKQDSKKNSVTRNGISANAIAILIVIITFGYMVLGPE